MNPKSDSPVSGDRGARYRPGGPLPGRARDPLRTAHHSLRPGDEHQQGVLPGLPGIPPAQSRHGGVFQLDHGGDGKNDGVRLISVFRNTDS